MKKCSEKFCFLRHRIMKIVVFPNILVSLGQNKNMIFKMYAEIFNELGINKYVIQIKNLKKYKEPIYKLINTIGL